MFILMCGETNVFQRLESTFDGGGILKTESIGPIIGFSSGGRLKAKELRIRLIENWRAELPRLKSLHGKPERLSRIQIAWAGKNSLGLKSVLVAAKIETCYDFSLTGDCSNQRGVERSGSSSGS